MLFEAVRQVIETMWPLLLLAVIMALAVTVLKAKLSASRRRTRSSLGASRGSSEAGEGLPVHQLDAIEAVEFETIPLLNREEARLLPKLEQLVSNIAPDYRLMAQVSLAEILKPRGSGQNKLAHDRAFRAINAKRVDFAIFDRNGRVVAAIEYQGTGHYQNRAVVRDAVKREVFRKAGVLFVEAAPETPFQEIAGPIEREIRRTLQA